MSSEFSPQLLKVIFMLLLIQRRAVDCGTRTHFVVDIDNKSKWPTLVETGGGGRSTTGWTVKMLSGLFRYHNWTTIAMVCEARRNPGFFAKCQTVRSELGNAMHVAKEAYSVLLYTEKDMSDDFPPPGTDSYQLREGWRNASALLAKLQVEPFDLREVNCVRWPGAVWPVPNRPACGYDGKDLACIAISTSRRIIRCRSRRCFNVTVLPAGNHDRTGIAAGAGVGIVVFGACVAVVLIHFQK
ncbi:hypothetical protein RvY_04274 [Ramazzottius varieornatus]|uniref:Receptor ligand binding region domain-containing protein n=1 Tax=Ramazzottius varieornatus TaxID=947166 RepID=A0A1D1UXY4_RAMVA|nr:hypothetical protein RvY_04274 [Ramazzottius varieornatus]